MYYICAMITTIQELFYSKDFKELVVETISRNPWFTPQSIEYAQRAIEEEFLYEHKFRRFCSTHAIDSTPKMKTLGVVCAGNLPLVGFGDMFYGLICGWNITLKPSSRDPLMRIFGKLDSVTVVDSIEELDHSDAIVVMGSDSTCALIEELYPSTPKLLRGTMHSVAILDSSVTRSELEKLYLDMFLYSGRGCRSVNHLYLSEDFSLDFLVTTIKQADSRYQLQMPREWADSYRYARAILSMTAREYIDGGFYLLVKGSSTMTATIGYSIFQSISEIDLTEFQHVAVAQNLGRSQFPRLEDFANGLSIPKFLSSLL